MFGDWVKLARLPNAVTAGAGVWLGHACLPGRFAWGEAALGSAAMALLAAAGNMQNDALDVEADRINRPDRAIPSGRVARGTVMNAALALYILAILAGFSLGRYDGFLTVSMASLLWLYNHRLKAMPLWGNLAVAALCALAVYFPEVPHFPDYTLFPVLFAFLTTLAREVAKDAEDMAGDLAVGYSTLPIRFGEKAAKTVSAGACIVVVLLLPVPWLRLGYRAGYPVIAAAGLLPLLATIVSAVLRPGTDWHSVQSRLKWAMLAGMAAILAGVVGMQGAVSAAVNQ
ncbi:MAG: geranylgeranylglycerol-phosphate geranylgeranyltransferase [Fibrobacteres bacterium]|nr:geranylgeranylglycerol-phosphate geranylgeranyltransferase [Fibrobacterota bacterium]